MQRDQQLLQLRPVLELNSEKTLEEEYFANTSLRPILKLQHTLLIAIFTHYLEEKSIALSSMNAFKQRVTIENAIKKDLPIRHTLMGCIIGHFTEEEYTMFLSNRIALQKRLTGLLIQRLTDTFIKPDTI
jgi:hypothetical protein